MIAHKATGRKDPARFLTIFVLFVVLWAVPGASAGDPAPGLLTLEHWTDPELGRLAGGDGQTGEA